MDARWHGDVRPNGEFAQLRTVCHGCRQMSHVHIEGDDGVSRLRPMIVPGDGTVTTEIAPGYLVSQPCTVCGDSDDIGWLAGLQPPI
ncbi:MAG: hypothetical protein ACRDQ5_28075 [Sciscionella sp.]